MGLQGFVFRVTVLAQHKIECAECGVSVGGHSDVRAYKTYGDRSLFRPTVNLCSYACVVAYKRWVDKVRTTVPEFL